MRTPPIRTAVPPGVRTKEPLLQRLKQGKQPENRGKRTHWLGVNDYLGKPKGINALCSM